MALRKSSDTISVVLFEDDGDVERTVEFKARWEICSGCDGCATDRGASVECDGGGFTSSQWAELDDEFRQNYLDGVYDRPCTYCEGLGRVQVIDRAAADPADLAIYDQNQRDEADYRAICAAERRMGA